MTLWTGRVALAVALVAAALVAAPSTAAAHGGGGGWRHRHRPAPWHRHRPTPWYRHHRPAPWHRHGGGGRGRATTSKRRSHGKGKAKRGGGGGGKKRGHPRRRRVGPAHRHDHGHDGRTRRRTGHHHPNVKDRERARDRSHRLANHGWDQRWRSGRATWYGGRDDPTMDEDEGSCLNQGYLRRPVHAYYSAPSDVSVFYPDATCQYPNPHGWWMMPLCPRTRRTCRDICMQLRCTAKYNTWSALAYGKQVEPEMCRGYKSVVVQFTDTCPANHPQNTKKKHNWCGRGQGGETHIDISWSAWDTIVAARDVGVVHMEWRIVDCSVGVGPKGWNQNVYKDVWRG